MSKPKNTRELLAYVERVERAAGNLKVHGGTVWNLAQLSDVIARHNKHNELIKVEVHNRNSGFKEQWGYLIYAYDSMQFEENVDE